MCGQTFDTTFGLDLHVHSTRVGSHYNIAPEARPRLSAAWVLFDADETNVFRADMAVINGKDVDLDFYQLFSYSA